MNVNEIMTPAVKCCSSSSSLDVIARMMWDQDCGAIPIVDDNHQPVGIVTDRDIAMAAMLNHQPLWDIQASTVIQGQQLICCNPHESVEACVEKMEYHSVRRILVTDEGGALCGIVSLGDAVAFTQPGKQRSRQQGQALASDQMLEMLRSVSAHHSEAVH